jgi:hypothetical protein
MRGMMKSLSVLFATVVLLSGVAVAEWVQLSEKSSEQPARYEVAQMGSERTVIEFEIDGFQAQAVEIEGEDYVTIALPGGHPVAVKGLPDLPKMQTSLIVPAKAHMTLNLVDAEYVTLETTPVAPSKGHLDRSTDPEAVPYEFAEFYGTNTSFPEVHAELNDPYILRDFRAVSVWFYPIRYNHHERTLEVCKRATFELVQDGIGQINVADEYEIGQRVSHDFLEIYRAAFDNFDYYESRYGLIPEPGRMLVICYNGFESNIAPFVEWKNQKGTPCKLALYPDSTGSGSGNVFSYIQSEYASPDGLTYIVIVGDAAQVPTLSGVYQGAASDPCYTKLAGGDHYPDALISRISSTSGTQVDNQVNKFVRYEKYPDQGAPGDDWYHEGTGIGSNDTGGTGIPDWERCNWLRDSLLNYTYTYVDQIYDPGATAAQVTTAVNDGRSIINYIGHGSGTSWSTTGFGVSHINALSNGYKNPFIIDVSCSNGAFTSYDECFAEAWLRTGTVASPAGAIGCYSASTSASWIPPCDMQAHAVGLLVGETRNTYGGICFNGVQYAMDIHGSGPGTEGLKLMEQYNIFGDCSILLRTDAPDPMTVNHMDVVYLMSETFDVTVTGVEGALCALYMDGVLYGYGYTDATGNVTIDFIVAPETTGMMTLTVTAYNKVPYMTDLEVVPQTGPYVTYNDKDIDDGFGNGDGHVNPNEMVYMNIYVENIGIEAANEVEAILRTSDAYVTVHDSLLSFGDVGVGEIVLSLDDCYYVTSPMCPDGHMIQFELALSDNVGNEWDSGFTETVVAPVLSFLVYAADDDAGGNGNGMIDPDETIDLDITVSNSGLGDANNVFGDLSTSDPYVDVNVGTADFSLIVGEGGVGTSVTPFEVYVHSDCPVPYYATMVLDLWGELGYNAQDTFLLVVGTTGYSSDMESTEGWSHAACQGGFTDEWHWSTERSNSPTHSWKCGTVGGQYSNYLDACLESPEFVLSPNSELTFFHWIDAETSGYYTGMCYDAGIVELQIDGGAWEYIVPEGGYPFGIRSGSGHPFPGLDGYSGYRPTWTQATFDLSGYTGMAKIRFRFGSDQGTVAEGWYIDDVAIQSAGGPDIDLDPWEFSVSLGADEIHIEILNIYNVGEQTLSFAASFLTDSAFVERDKRATDIRRHRSWLTVDPSSGNVAPDAYTPVDVNFNSAGLEDGVYWGRIKIDSDDPDETILYVPVEMEVLSEICGDADGSGEVTPADGYMVLNYFGAGPSPVSCWSANVNGDGVLTTADGYHILNFLGSGSALDCQPCELTVGYEQHKPMKTKGPSVR